MPPANNDNASIESRGAALGATAGLPSSATFDTALLDELAVAHEGAQPKVAFGTAAFTPDGRSLYVTSDARGEYLELAKVDLATGQYQWLAPDLGWDVDSIEVDAKSGLVAFTVNVDGASRLYLLGEGKPVAVELPLGVIAGLEFSPDGKQLGFTLARPDAPADAYSIAIAVGRAAGEATRWTHSEVGGLNPTSFVRPERISFSSFDGREVPAYYYRPPGASRDKPAAVVIDIHGGPEGQSRPLFSGATQFLVVEEGIAVIYPNVRGSAGYGKTYLQLDNAERREDSVKDIGALLDWIGRQPELDASRIAVQGGSYGGYMVLASLVHFGDRIRAGIDIVGIANFISFLERTSPYRQDLRRAEYGDERDPEMRKVFERISPLAGAEKIRAALLVAHGTNDPRVPYFEAQQIAEKVRGAGRPVWTVYADNEGHGFAKKDNRDYLTAVQMRFLEQFLKGT
ncbi:MAG: prolyl oligopeptidase family serine peptidase [Pirellulales bacterium]|nr:prolyl oligopeptidase family serine peptidase [Pirellulales bacterium]